MGIYLSIHSCLLLTPACLPITRLPRDFGFSVLQPRQAMDQVWPAPRADQPVPAGDIATPLCLNNTWRQQQGCMQPDHTLPSCYPLLVPNLDLLEHHQRFDITTSQHSAYAGPLTCCNATRAQVDITTFAFACPLTCCNAMVCFCKGQAKAKCGIMMSTCVLGVFWGCSGGCSGGVLGVCLRTVATSELPVCICLCASACVHLPVSFSV